jgi:hypothetical protein
MHAVLLQQVALRDLAHARPQCGNHAFRAGNSQDNSKRCSEVRELEAPMSPAAAAAVVHANTAAAVQNALDTVCLLQTYARCF